MQKGSVRYDTCLGKVIGHVSNVCQSVRISPSVPWYTLIKF